MTTIKITSKKLLQALSKCQKAVSVNKVVPAAENFRLVGKDGIISVSACNLEVSLQTQVEAEFTAPFDLLAPAIKLLDFIKKLADQPITISIDENYLITIKHNSGVAKMQGEDGKDFPTIETLDGVSITIADLAAELYSVAYARGGTDDARQFIYSIWMDVTKTECNFSAGDGFVMANAKVIGTFKPLKCLLPFNAANILLTMQGDAELNISKNSITAIIGDTTIKFRLVDAVFPDLKKLIPTPVNTIKVDRLELLSCLDRVIDFANQATKLVKLTASKSGLKIETCNFDLNEQATEDIPCKDGCFSISFKGNLMQSALPKFTGDNINIGFTGEKIALLLTEDNNENYFALIMPTSA